MNKMTIVKSFLILLTASTILTSCDKDDDVTPDPAARLKFDWKIVDITTPKVNQPATDSSLLKACMSDDIVKFSNAGFDFQDGAAKCDSTIFPYAKGSWQYDLSNDSLRLAPTSVGKYMSWKITKLNDSVLTVRYTDSTNPAKKIAKSIYFKH